PDGGVGDQQPEQAADERRDEADLDAVAEVEPVRLLPELLHVVEREAAVRVLERPHRHLAGGEDQEEEGVEEEGDGAEPRERQPPPAGRRRPEELVRFERPGQVTRRRPSWASRSRSWRGPR